MQETGLSGNELRGIFQEVWKAGESEEKSHGRIVFKQSFINKNSVRKLQKMDNRLAYVYLIATSYSGSTLLSMVMNAHPQVASVGELANSIGFLMKSGKIDKYHCSCGREINLCEFWGDVRRYCSEQGVDLDLHNFDTNLDAGHGKHINKFMFGKAKRFKNMEILRDRLLWTMPGFRQMIKDSIGRNAVITQAILKASEKEIFLDASKDAKRGFYLSKDNKLDFKLLHLVRDVTGFMNSCRKRNSEGYFETATNEWIRVHREALRIKSKLPDNSYLLVHYERLCEYPSETLQEICQFIGVGTEDLVASARESRHHVIGNNMRRQTFNAIRLDEAWKTDLPANYIAECLQKTGPLRRELGYK